MLKFSPMKESAVNESAAPALLSARMLNEFVYCPRLFYYESVENVFVHNADTRERAAQHQRVDSGKGKLPKAAPTPSLLHYFSTPRLHDSTTPPLHHSTTPLNVTIPLLFILISPAIPSTSPSCHSPKPGAPALRHPTQPSNAGSPVNDHGNPEPNPSKPTEKPNQVNSRPSSE